MPRLLGFWFVILVLPLSTACRREQPQPAQKSVSPSLTTGNVSTGTTPLPPSGDSALDGYDLEKPTAEHKLPNRLREISGIVALTENELACVQDENGSVFFLSLDGDKSRERIKFGERGDYEDLAVAGADLYVLRSDATLYRIADYRAPNPSVTSVRLDIHAIESEALTFDPGPRQLLLAPKSRVATEEDSDARPIFVYDLATSQLLEAPRFTPTTDALRAFVRNRGVGKKKAKQEVPRFRPSALSIHPITSELFVLAGADHILASFDAKGRVTGLRLLDPKDFPRAEGMTFLPNGELLLSTEGVDKRARLYRFAWRAKGR